MATWWQDVATAVENLGGVAAYKDIYAEVRRLRGDGVANLEAVVRKEVERHSSDSRAFEGRRDLFYSVEGLGGGVWGLRGADRPTLPANDLDVPDGAGAPERVEQFTFRIVRETALARRLKKLHQHECQLCSLTVTLADGSRYSEGHHLRPLGGPHHGPDVASNIIVVCPTCHVLLDYFAMPLVSDSIRRLDIHAIAAEHIAYHNARHFEARSKAQATQD